MWWHASVVPATQEAEPRESLKPGRWRLQSARITPLTALQPGDGARLHLKKEKNEKKTSIVPEISFSGNFNFLGNH